MTSAAARRIKASYEDTHQRLAETLGLETQNKIILEAYSQAVQALLAADDEGWTLISGALVGGVINRYWDDGVDEAKKEVLR